MSGTGYNTWILIYAEIWKQFGGANKRPGYIMAGSAYALKPNGSLGYAATAAGEGVGGELMERCGFPALRQLGFGNSTIAMVYVTHNQAIEKMLANPAPFIAELLAKAEAVGLSGFDIDYEPQQQQQQQQLFTGAAFMAFLGQLAAAMESKGLTLTIDVGGCPQFNSFSCAGAKELPGLGQTNCMHTFGSSSLPMFKQLAGGDAAGLGAKWAPGFEPGNMKENDGAAFQSIMDYLRTSGVSRIATWEVHELNIGVPQPQWLFDAVNSFLDAE